MFMYNHESIEALEVCIRSGNVSYSAKVGISNANIYLDFLLSQNAISNRQYEVSASILSLGNIGYALFNIASNTEFRVYVAKPNLFGYTIGIDGTIIKQKEYIDDYYTDLSTGIKKYYHILDCTLFPTDIDVPSTFIQVPIRALVDDNNQTYFEFLRKDDMQTYMDKINKEYAEEVEKLNNTTPIEEVLTWTKQENEARAYLANSAVSTPLIDALASSRGVTKMYLVNKIIAKADAYATAIGVLTGEMQRKKDMIKGNKWQQ